MEQFISLSLETNLFFARIMKEHALFLEAGFPCADTAWSTQARQFRLQFEALLDEVVCLADGRVSRGVLRSGELTTKFTLCAERRTQKLSGILIDSAVTQKEETLNAREREGGGENRELFCRIRRINERALRLVGGLICLKEQILKEVRACCLFTANYPLLIEHITREARLYRDTLEGLMSGRGGAWKRFGTEQFWNRIMMEHALFIRGMLDPSEEEQIGTANQFAERFRELLRAEDCACQMEKSAEACRQECRTGCSAGKNMTSESLEETRKFRSFKAAGTEGILDGKLASVILPLLADHVLRESSHYIRILEEERR